MFSGTSIDPRQLPVVTTAAKQSATDQYWQGATFTPNGTLVVSYYDRRYGSDNRTGYSDITVSVSHHREGFAHKRASAPGPFRGTTAHPKPIAAWSLYPLRR